MQSVIGISSNHSHNTSLACCVISSKHWHSASFHEAIGIERHSVQSWKSSFYEVTCIVRHFVQPWHCASFYRVTCTVRHFVELLAQWRGGWGGGRSLIGTNSDIPSPILISSSSISWEKKAPPPPPPALSLCVSLHIYICISINICQMLK